MGNQDVSGQDMLEHAWRYFALHAEQRMSVFNFFLVLSGLVAAGLAASLQRDRSFQLFGVALGFLLALISFVFWKLDQRTGFLITHAEDAIMQLERQFFTVTAARLIGSERECRATATSGAVITRMWTYRSAFRLAFAVMGLVGFGGAILSLCRHVR